MNTIFEKVRRSFRVETADIRALRSAQLLRELATRVPRRPAVNTALEEHHAR
jgi:hypothetical protein